MGIMLIIYPGIVGFSSKISSFFSYKFFNHLAKLNFGAFAMHVFLLEFLASFSMTGQFYSQFNCAMFTSGFIFTTLTLTFILHLLFQSTIASLIRKKLRFNHIESNFMIPELAS